jgi:hypothetical protein
MLFFDTEDTVMVKLSKELDMKKTSYSHNCLK